MNIAVLKRITENFYKELNRQQIFHYSFNKTLLQQQHIVFLDVRIPYQVLLYMIKMVYSGRYIIIGSYRTIFKKTSYRLKRRLFADIIR